MITKRNITSMRIFSLAAFVSLTLLLFCSCDKLEEPFLIQAENVDTVACPAPEFPVLTNHIKRILLEDYTGHICVNCPRAALTARDLKEEYGDQLVLMAIHAGGFAKPFASGNYTYDFQTPAGTLWDDEFNISAVGNPNGMVNRRKFNNTFIVGPSEWSGKVASMAAETPILDIQVINEYTPGEKKLCTHIQTEFLQTVDKDLKLVVAITEDSIVAAQKNNDPLVGTTPEILDYVHMHVLRGTITTAWGSTIASSGVANQTSIIKSYRYLIPDKVVPKNCRVIAFVYDNDTKEVLQAAEAEVISE
jgi:hypothetical protein